MLGPFVAFSECGPPKGNLIVLMRSTRGFSLHISNRNHCQTYLSPCATHKSENRGAMQTLPTFPPLDHPLLDLGTSFLIL